MKKIIGWSIVVVGGILLVVWFGLFFPRSVKEDAQIGCTMEAKLCSDGTAVGRSGPRCEFAPCPSVPQEDENIRVTIPRSGDVIVSPVIIRGEARGTWYFEGSFPLSIVDENGLVVGSGVARSLGEWMTTEFVPFEALVSFSLPSSMMGSIILSRDNPSGLPENDAQIAVPVRFR